MVSNNEETDQGLLKMTLHNLATINYIEILEFQEKGAPSNLMQQLDEVESSKREENLKNRKLNE